MIGRLFNNWPYKLISLGAAVMLFSYVNGVENPYVSTSAVAHLEVIKPQSGYEVILPEREVPISLRGPREKVEQAAAGVDSGEIRAIVDLSRLHAGTHTVPIKITMPERFSIDVIEPTVRDVSVTIEPVFSRKVSVEVKLLSSPPIGWVMSEPSMTPGVAAVSGRGSLVDSVARLVVAVGPTTDSPSIDREVRIRPVDAQGNEVKSVDVSPETAHVTLRLVEAPANRTLYVSANLVGDPQFPYKVVRWSATPAAVTVTGTPSALEAASTITTDPLDVTGAVSDLEREVSLRVPRGLRVVGVDRVTIAVKVQNGQSP